MPVYEYYCDSCKSKFEVRRPMSEASIDTACPECGKPAVKRFSSPTIHGFRDTSGDHASFLASGYDN